MLQLWKSISKYLTQSINEQKLFTLLFIKDKLVNYPQPFVRSFIKQLILTGRIISKQHLPHNCCG